MSEQVRLLTGDVAEETSPAASLGGVLGGAPPAARQSPAGSPRVRPRAQARRPSSSVAAVDVGVPVTVFGAVPHGVTHWVARRRTPTGEWVPCGHVYPDTLTEAREFPIGELSEQTLSDRWGAGTYDVSWVRHRAEGGRAVLRASREVRIVAPPSAAPSSPAAAAPMMAAPSLADPMAALGEAMRVMDLIESRADAKIDGMAKLAAVLGAGARASGGGISADEMLRVLREERASAEATLTARMAALRAELVEDDGEDDGATGDAVTAAARVGAGLVKGKGTLATVLNFAAANPEIAKPLIAGGLPILAAAFSKIADLFTAAPAPPPPRPVSRAPEPPPAALAPPAPSPSPADYGSLSAWEPRPPAPAPGTEGPAGSS